MGRSNYIMALYQLQLLFFKINLLTNLKAISTRLYLRIRWLGKIGFQIQM